MEERNSEGWDDDPLQSLARELRQTVGAELRAEAEIAEHDTETGRLRRRDLPALMREAAEHGDQVSLVTAARTVTGSLAQVGRDYVTITTRTEVIDARTTAGITILHPSPRGGTAPSAGSITFKARLSEYEQTGEPVTVVASRVGHSAEGVVAVVAEDHLLLRDRDRLTHVIPFDTIDLVLRPRPPAR